MLNSLRRFYFPKPPIILMALVPMVGHAKQASVQLRSPNGQNTIAIFPAPKTAETGGVCFSVAYKGRHVIQPSVIRLLSTDIDFSGIFTITQVERDSVENEWTTELGERSVIPDIYNEVRIFLESAEAKLNIICRAYDEGIAFAYEIPHQNGIERISLDDEQISYRFEADHPVWSTPKRKPGKLTAQGRYRKIPLSQLEHGAERPLVIECGDHLVIALAEAGLVDYARPSFVADPDAPLAIRSCLDGKMYAPQQDKHSGALLSERSERAKVSKALPFQSPWRVIMMGQDPGELLENNYLIQNLNPPNAIEDISWVRPGKALRETTLTTDGGLRAIDFVAAHGMQYVHFDAGWYGNEMDNASDATTVSLDPKRSAGPFDLKRIIAYAHEKEVRVMLYVNRRALEKQLDELLPLYKEWGVSGIKFGFVQVGDQEVTTWLHDAVKKAADCEMVVDIHDEYRPTGFSRTYPNLLTQEGIRGDETTVPNEHTLITMFTRMLAGAADNTVCYYNDRVERMGSHASQLAKTVCLFSPLQFLYWYDRVAEAPDKTDALWGETQYIGNEPELEFFDQVPTTWDETKVLEAIVSEIGVIARRNGKDWYIGGINGKTERTVNLDCSFLEPGATYTAKLYTDDENVNTRTRVKIEELELNSTSRLQLYLKPDNGFAIQLKKR